MMLNAFLLALRALRRNVMRAALTTLGIVIGVAAVIVMVTLGNATTIMVTNGIASLGSDLLTIMPGQQVGPGGAASNATPFTLADAEMLDRGIAAIRTVAPASSMPMNVVLGNKNRSTTVTGATNAYFDAGEWQLSEGRWFSDADLRGGRAVCIVGDTVRRELIGSQSALGVRLRLRTVSCEIVGLLKAKGESTFGQDRDDAVVVPLRMFQRRIAGNDNVAQIQVAVGPDASMLRAQQDIERLLRERRRLAPGDDNDFVVMNPQDIANTLSGTIRLLTLLLAAIAGISLLVGGIGIMNIMIVSVTERTREIGVRMAIGALEREVLLQFLVEATVLSVIGGLIGILLALAASAGVAVWFDLPFVVDWPMMMVAFAFSAAVGVVFGFVPAQRAARLNPIDALRHE